ncbi:MAG: cellulose biosynthesis protein BcsG, partial [Proteobacteria bacterium]|nr:cellulose biosynthesis protein BcsG [Candidatus Avisuccinivibrio stercorigallinarum]
MRAQTYAALNALSWWNVYFILKFLLGVNQLIDFEPLYNLLLLCLLLLPLKYRLLHYLRQALAIPSGVILAYHESYQPGLSAFTANAAGVGDFDLGFVADFLLSALNFTYVGIVALVLLLFLLLQDYLRFTFLSCAAVLYLTLQP